MVKKEKTQQECSECAKIQQRIFEREVDEELQQEKLHELWKKYRFVVFGFVLAVLFGTIGSEVYHSWKLKTEQAESERYENAIVMAHQGDTEKANADLQQLGQDGKTGYRYLAELERASLLLSEKKTKEALAILKKLADSADTPKPLKDAVILAYVGNQLDYGNTAELQQYLAPLVADTGSAYYGAAVELSALLHILSGENDLAIQKLQVAAASPKVAEPVKMRINTLIERLKK